MTIGNMWDELAIWLVPITLSIVLVQYYAWYLVGLFIVYFVTVRSLEKLTVSGLRQKPVMITGCDSGFGFELALKCVREGMPVFAACYAEQGEKLLAQAASKIADSEILLNTFVMDVRSDESVNKGREFVGSKLGGKGLWGIVNNAGIGDLRGWDDWMTTKLYQRCWDVNTLGVIRVSHAFKDLVKKQKGRIVNVSSIMGKFPLPAWGPYSVSKYAVAAYNDILRMEMAQFGIIVSCLEPGFYRSPQSNPAAAREDIAKTWACVPEHVKEEYGEEYFKWTQDLFEGSMEYKCKPGSWKVVDCYFSALTSQYPRRRYQIGYDSTFQFTPLSYLPSRWQDWLMRFYFAYVDKQPRLKAAY